MANLAPVLERREHVRAPEKLNIGIRAVCPDFFKQVFEADHGLRCLSLDDGGFKASYGSRSSDRAKKRQRTARERQFRTELALTYNFLLHYTDPVSAVAVPPT